ncbi:MAG: biotin synthase [bacterium]|nr:MAG: biotin synthase [bacterium]
MNHQTRITHIGNIEFARGEYKTASMNTGTDLINICAEKALHMDPVTPGQALDLLNLPADCIMPLMAAADRVRRFHKGNVISLCSILNARSGACTEDCAFCPQSVYQKSEADEYRLMENGRIVEAASQAVKDGAQKFGIVTSGKGPEADKGDFAAICGSIKNIRSEVGIYRCASLGVITPDHAAALKEAGLQEFHHNLETARSFYHNVCTTRSYDENVESVMAAKNAGLRVCCGGIFGMGETAEQRIELAEELRRLDVDSIPLNFLHPLKGTKLEGVKPLRPLEILRIISVYRLFFPDRDIKVAGGREVNLRDLQSFIFFAGANSTMLGNYLTTKGRKAEDDLKMIADLELEVVD